MEGPPDFADRADKNILANDNIGPDLPLNRFAGEDFARFRGEGQQHLHDFRFEMNRLPIPFQCIQAGMNNPVADPKIPAQKTCSFRNGLYPAHRVPCLAASPRFYLKTGELLNIGKSSGKDL
jgi:hypothetical protein